MKKFLAAIAVLALMAGVALADSPVQKTFSLALGAGALTNEQPLAAVQLPIQVERIELINTDPVAATATVRRASGGITNVISSIVVASGYGTGTNAAFYLFGGDKLLVTGGGTNTGTARITGQYLP